MFAAPSEMAISGKRWFSLCSGNKLVAAGYDEVKTDEIFGLLPSVISATDPTMRSRFRAIVCCWKVSAPNGSRRESTVAGKGCLYAAAD